MESESEETRKYLGSVAKICAELFAASGYPRLAFNFPFHGVPKKLAYPIIELHIRVPSIACLPQSLKPPMGQPLSKDQISNLMRSCPAIENIRLRPEFQRYGFLNALMKELGRVGVPYVNISNIENDELALHYLHLSRNPGSGVELTSSPNTVSPTIRYPTFSVNLGERYIAREI